MFLQTCLRLGAVQAISLALRLSKHLLYGLLVRLPACGWHILREIFLVMVFFLQYPVDGSRNSFLALNNSFLSLAG